MLFSILRRFNMKKYICYSIAFDVSHIFCILMYTFYYLIFDSNNYFVQIFNLIGLVAIITKSCMLCYGNFTPLSHYDCTTNIFKNIILIIMEFGCIANIVGYTLVQNDFQNNYINAAVEFSLILMYIKYSYFLTLVIVYLIACKCVHSNQVANAAHTATTMYPTFKYTNVLSEEADTCAICIEDYIAGEDIKTLPCFHNFHTECIDSWLKIKANCPICKIELNQV